MMRFFSVFIFFIGHFKIYFHIKFYKRFSQNHKVCVGSNNFFKIEQVFRYKFFFSCLKSTRSFYNKWIIFKFSLIKNKHKLNIDDHLFMNIRIADYRTEFVKRYFSIFILIGKNNCLINYLLQLGVFKIVTDHHFQYLWGFFMR